MVKGTGIGVNTLLLMICNHCIDSQLLIVAVSMFVFFVSRNQFGVYGAHLMECMSKNDSSSSSLSGVYRSSYRSQGQQGKSHSLVVFDHEHVWKLDVDEETNNRVRLDFFYEQVNMLTMSVFGITDCV